MEKKDKKIMRNPLAVFATWFLLAITGSWFIWASYMAIKFISEDAQGQHAAFSVIQKNSQVGAFIVIPIILTVVWAGLSLFIADELND